MVKFSSIRLTLAIVTHFRLEILQIDLKLEFLNGELDN